MTTVTLSASSALASMPVAWLRDQLRSKRWRSASGWTITTGVNDKINFLVGATPYTATLAAGTDATGVAFTTRVVNALTAAVANGWSCTYASNKFTISGTSAFTLLWASGTNTATACHKELGFTVADTGSATSQAAPNVSYQSRHWLKADLGSALASKVAIALDSNVSASGTLTQQANASDAWTAPTVSQALTLSTDRSLGIYYWTSDQTYRYWRLLIDDCANSDGYAQLGVWFVGPHTQPTIMYAIGWTRRANPLSDVAQTPDGAHWTNERAQQPTWNPRWSEAPAADQTALRAAFEMVPKGLCFFFSFDTVSDITNTEYVWLADGWEETLVSGTYYDVSTGTLIRAVA